MKSRKLRSLERRLIESLQQKFGDPESEAPTTLRDQPNEIVYTALQPKKAPEERAGVMGMGQMPTITVDAQMRELMEGPQTVGGATMAGMLPPSASPEPQAPPQIQLPPSQEAQQLQQQAAGGQIGQGQAPQGGAPQRPPQSEQEQLQDLLVTG